MSDELWGKDTEKKFSDVSSQQAPAAPDTANTSDSAAAHSESMPQSPAVRPSFEPDGEAGAQAWETQPDYETFKPEGGQIYIDRLGGMGLSRPDEQYTRPQQQYVSAQGNIPQPPPAGYPAQGYFSAQTNAYAQAQQSAYSPYHAPQYTKEQLDKQKKDKRRNRRTLIIVLAVVAVVLVGAVTAIVWAGNYFGAGLPSGSNGQSDSQGPGSYPGQTPSGVENGPTIELVDPPDAGTPQAEQAQLTIPEIYQNLSPSVVMILAESRIGGGSLGTGIVMSADGYIITNEHVIDGSDKITIVMNDNTTTYTARVIGADANSDIAVLKVDADGLSPAVFGDSDKVVVGEAVVAIGNPYGTEYVQSVTNGIISGIRRGIYIDGMKTDLLQTNAPLNPGNSGGPLINGYGQVIGIVNSKIMTDGTDTYEGMAFAIPMTKAKSIIDELIRYGYIPPVPVIGVTVSYLDEDAATAQNAVPGCLVASVDSTSDAYKQGIRKGDIITQINGITFTDLDGFIDEKNRFAVGDEIELTYWRNGQTYTIKVELMAS